MIQMCYKQPCPQNSYYQCVGEPPNQYENRKACKGIGYYILFPVCFIAIVNLTALLSCLYNYKAPIRAANTPGANPAIQPARSEQSEELPPTYNAAFDNSEGANTLGANLVIESALSDQKEESPPAYKTITMNQSSSGLNKNLSA